MKFECFSRRKFSLIKIKKNFNYTMYFCKVINYVTSNFRLDKSVQISELKMTKLSIKSIPLCKIQCYKNENLK